MTIEASPMSLSTRAAQSCVRVERDGEVAVIVADAGAAQARQVLNAIVDIATDDTVKAAVLLGIGSACAAGPDNDTHMPALIAAIGACPKPIVAAIDGAAMGCAFEIALGCDARVAHADAVVGLPGAARDGAGTQLLPRLVGVAAAIDIICSGRSVSAMEAVSLGLIDAVVEGALKAGAIDYARALGMAARKRRPDEYPAPKDSADSIEQAELAALRAPGTGGNRSDVAATIRALKSAAATGVPIRSSQGGM